MYVLEIEMEDGSVVEYQLAYISHSRRYRKEIKNSKSAVLWAKGAGKSVIVEVLK